MDITREMVKVVYEAMAAAGLTVERELWRGEFAAGGETLDTFEEVWAAIQALHENFEKELDASQEA